MQYYILPTDKDIQHYGVLGMKWGIRRYQPYSTVPRKSGKGGKELGEAKKHKSLYSRIGGEARENVIRKSLEDQEASEKYFKKEKDLIGSKVDKKLKLESKIRQKEEKGINTDREVSELKKNKERN